MNGQQTNQPTIQTAPTSRLISFGELFNRSISIFKNHPQQIITISALTFGLGGLINLIYNISTSNEINARSLLLSVITSLAIVFLSTWGTASIIFYLVDLNKNAPAIEYLKKGLNKFWSLLWLNIFLGIIILLGLLLLVIPGIVFGVWFMFAVFFLIIDNNPTTVSMEKSKNLVKGYWWAVLGRSAIYILLSVIVFIILSFIPYGIGNLVGSLFIYPLYLIYTFHLYKNLREIKAGG